MLFYETKFKILKKGDKHFTVAVDGILVLLGLEPLFAPVFAKSSKIKY